MINQNENQDWRDAYKITPEKPEQDWRSLYALPTNLEDAEQPPSMAEILSQANLYQSGSELQGEGFLGGQGFMQQRAQREKVEQEARQKIANEVSGYISEPVVADRNFEENLKDYGLSWDMSRNKNFKDIQTKFLKVYPEGEIRSVPTESSGTITVARKNPNEPFRQLSPGWENFSDIFLNETALFGAIGSIAGPKGTFVGTAFGSVLQRAIESSRGYEQQQGTGTDVTLAIFEGIIAGGIDATTRRLFSLARISPRQVTAVDLRDAQDRLTTNAIENIRSDVPELLEGQVGGEFKAGLLLQVKSTSDRVQRALDKQNEALYDWFAVRVNQIPTEGMSDETLGLIANAYRAQIEEIDTFAKLNRPRIGNLLEEGLPVWEKTTKDLIFRNYSRSGILSEGVSFDLTNTKNAVAEIRTGVYGRGLPVKKESAIVDAQGRPMIVEEVPDIRLPEGQAKELNAVMNAIEALDPNISRYVNQDGVEFTSVEQVARLRTRLFTLKTDPNVDSDVRQHANRLWHELTETMESPIGGSPEFLEVHRTARQMHKDMEDVFKYTRVAQALRGDIRSPENIGKLYATPGNYTEVELMSRLLPKTQWEEMRKLLAGDIVNGSPTAQQALNRLERFRASDPQLLRLIMTESEERLAEQVLVNRVRMESQPFQRALKRFNFNVDRAKQVFENSTPSELRDQIARSGGVNSEFAASLRGYAYSRILNSSRREGYDNQLNANQVVDAINALKKTEKFDIIFSEKDLLILKDLERVAVPMSKSADVGGAMQAGGVRGRTVRIVGDLLKGDTSSTIGVGHQLLSNDATAFILSRPAFRKVYEPMPESLEGRFRRTVLYFQTALRDSYPEEESDQQAGVTP